MSGLERVVRDYVERRSLAEDQLCALEALQGSAPSSRSARPGRFRVAPGAALPAILVSAILAPILVWMFLSMLPDSELPSLIADEVAANHLELKPMEVKGGDFSEIRGFFTELDFAPQQTRLADVAGLGLVGGRYCSVQGVTAAQLRLRSEDAAGLQTLYQARYDPRRFGPIPNLDEGEQPLLLSARGLQVSLWLEKGVLFALVAE